MSLEPELYGVNERTAAMIMAIVADEMAVPVEELDFKYIREVEYMKFRVTLNGKTYEVEAEKGAPMPETVYTAPAAAPAPAVEAPAAAAPAPAPAPAPAAVSGTVVISGNKVGGKANNVYLPSGVTMAIGNTLGFDAKILHDVIHLFAHAGDNETLHHFVDEYISVYIREGGNIALPEIL